MSTESSLPDGSIPPLERWLYRHRAVPEALRLEVERLGGRLEPFGPLLFRCTLPTLTPTQARTLRRLGLEREPQADRTRRPGRWAPLLAPRGGADLEGDSTQLRDLIVRDAKSGLPVTGARVDVFGEDALIAAGKTDARGRVSLVLQGAKPSRMEILPASAHWGLRLPFGPLPDEEAPREVRLEPLSVPTNGYGWALTRALKVDRVHRAGIWGKGVRVAVLDTGIARHPALKLAGGNNTVDDEPTSAWLDRHWHGTHVAGIIAGQGGTTGMQGVAPGCELYAVRVGNIRSIDGERFENSLFETDLIEGLRWCIDQKMDVINLSLYTRPSRAVDAVLEEAYLAGVVIVAPSGNLAGALSLGDSGRLDYPAVHPRVVSVGAVGRLGTYPEGSYFEGAEDGAIFSSRFPDYYVAGFSRSGDGLNLVAPGVAILSTVPPTLQGFDENETALTGFTCWMGTSQAAPFVAGLAALSLETHPDLLARRDGSRVDGLLQLLKGSAISLGLDPRVQGWGMPFAPACVGI